MEILGWIVTFLFSACYWPQLYKSWKRKSVGDISVWAWLLQVLGYGLGIKYGLWLGHGPLIWGYCHGFVCSILLLLLYYKYRGNNVQTL